MFDPDKLDAAPVATEDPFDFVATLEQEQLLELRARIQARLPMSLTDLDLESELVLQYQQGKVLLAKVINDHGTPANQKAQVANSCAATLQSLVKMQTTLHDAERMKKLEQILIKVIRTLPKEQQEAFFQRYEQLNAEES